MDNALKILISAACIAVIAAVGYYFWNERQAALRIQEVTNFQKARTNCIAALDRYRDLKASPDDEGTVAGCLMLGYIDQQMVDRTVEDMRRRAKN